MPSKVQPTPEITERVCAAIRACKPCRRAGVDALTLREWMERGKKAKRGRYRQFYLAVEAATEELRQFLRDTLRALDETLRAERERANRVMIACQTGSRPV
jgi:hypothetical protein